MATRGIEASWAWRGAPDEAPIRRGAVVVDARGVLVSAGPADALRERHPGVAWERHEGVILPGLVNARLSLELAHARGPLAEGPGFAAWMRAEARARVEAEPRAQAVAIEAAVRELERLGVAAVGEVSASLAAVPALRGSRLLARVYSEVAGLREETASTLEAMARQEGARASLAEDSGPVGRLGWSLTPHSLLGTHPRVVARLVAGAAGPVMLRLAWAEAERCFLRDGTGAFAEWARQRGADPADWDPPGSSPVEQAARLGLLGERLVATHLTRVSEDEARQLAATGTRCVLCPRASLAVEDRLPPLEALLAAGLRPGLGTGSPACVEGVDVLDEVALLAERAGGSRLPELLAMATSWGAAALGLERRVGRLQPGLAPGIVLFEGAVAAEPLRHVIAGGPRTVLSPPGDDGAAPSAGAAG